MFKLQVQLSMFNFSAARDATRFRFGRSVYLHLLDVAAADKPVLTPEDPDFALERGYRTLLSSKVLVWRGRVAI